MASGCEVRKIELTVHPPPVSRIIGRLGDASDEDSLQEAGNVKYKPARVSGLQHWCWETEKLREEKEECGITTGVLENLLVTCSLILPPFRSFG
ncbi:hypothetical protein NDU88_000947 [Pleurodeles waltl]|uniref:Uncharacterized protein n=1 Tax=Pleurodeles waltl TaxID=8319 RepID=A0AAV7N9F0_PLEWA|nr:hypothetical protein NDU88_000947 [Pleurodeles waltl]